jgi:hypothetical protein
MTDATNDNRDLGEGSSTELNISDLVDFVLILLLDLPDHQRADHIRYLQDQYKSALAERRPADGVNKRFLRLFYESLLRRATATTEDEMWKQRAEPWDHQG